jgi:osmotically-inducible protein OsmY
MCLAVASSPVIGGSAACGGSTRAESGPASSPESTLQRAVREELRRAIAADPTLKARAISFTIEDGDIIVTGTVDSEDERRRINELAMSVSGVTSVANALRVSAE